jgi:hypothetical protein
VKDHTRLLPSYTSTCLACALTSKKIEVHRILSLGRESAEASTGPARYNFIQALFLILIAQGPIPRRGWMDGFHFARRH